MRKEYGEAIVLMKKKIKCSFAPIATGLFVYGTSCKIEKGLTRKNFQL